MINLSEYWHPCQNIFFKITELENIVYIVFDKTKYKVMFRQEQTDRKLQINKK